MNEVGPACDRMRTDSVWGLLQKPGPGGEQNRRSLRYQSPGSGEGLHSNNLVRLRTWSSAIGLCNCRAIGWWSG